MAKKKKPVTRLSDLDLHEVSLVKRGANKKKFFMTKSEEEAMDKLIAKILKADINDEKSFDAVLEKLLPEDIKDEDKEGLVAMAKAMCRLLGGSKEKLSKEAQVSLLEALAENAGIELPKEEVAKASKLGDFLKSEMEKKGLKAADLAKAAGISESTVGQILRGEIVAPPERRLEGFAKALGVSMDKIKDQLPEELRKMIENDNPGKGGTVDEKTTEELRKSIVDEVQKANKEVIDELKKSNGDLQTELKKEQDLRVTKEFEEKAKEWGYKGDRVAEVAKTLKQAKDNMDDEGYKTIEKSLKESAEALKNSKLFKELGGGGQTKNVEDEIETKVAELMKSNDKLTKAQAETQVLEDNPELYQKYLDENPIQQGGAA